MTKFADKVRKGRDQDYDDYYYDKSSKNDYNERRRKSEQAELRKMRMRHREDEDFVDEYYDPRHYRK